MPAVTMTQRRRSPRSGSRRRPWNSSLLRPLRYLGVCDRELRLEPLEERYLLTVDFGDARTEGHTALRPGANQQQSRPAGRIALYAMDESGYASLMKLASAAFFDPELRGRWGAARLAVAAKVPLLIVTRGPHGALAVRDGIRTEVHAEPVAKVVDTTGAEVPASSRRSSVSWPMQ